MSNTNKKAYYLIDNSNNQMFQLEKDSFFESLVYNMGEAFNYGEISSKEMMSLMDAFKKADNDNIEIEHTFNDFKYMIVTDSNAIEYLKNEVINEKAIDIYFEIGLHLYPFDQSRDEVEEQKQDMMTFSSNKKMYDFLQNEVLLKDFEDAEEIKQDTVLFELLKDFKKITGLNFTSLS